MTTEEEYGIICENVRFLRQQHGLSRTAIARRLHITLKTLDLLEAGTFPDRIHIGFFFHVHQAFGVPPHKMITTRLSVKM